MVNKPAIEKILLIDDDEDDCMVFKMAVAEAKNGTIFLYRNSCDDIISVLQEEKPNLIFLDINLPRINGIEGLQLIREANKELSIPVVMYSSSELPRDLMESYLHGAALYFRKPNNITTLVESLKSIFEMDWHHPDAIKAHYYKDGTYHVFDLGLPV